MTESAAASPTSPRSICDRIIGVTSDQCGETTKMTALSVVTLRVNVKIMPASTAGRISGSSTRHSVCPGVAPMLVDASSSERFIWSNAATAERIEYGSERTENATMMMAAVPVSNSGRLLNARPNARPSTVPGIASGRLATKSTIPRPGIRLRATK